MASPLYCIAHRGTAGTDHCPECISGKNCQYCAYRLTEEDYPNKVGDVMGEWRVSEVDSIGRIMAIEKIEE